jgi:protoheme IX farnesyltransferase
VDADIRRRTFKWPGASLPRWRLVPGRLPQRLSRLYALTKPKVVRLVVFCAVIGMLLAGRESFDLARALFATAGIWLIASSAAVFNCLLERRVDARMARTRRRMGAGEHPSAGAATALGVALCAAGCTTLWIGVNRLTLALTLATFVGYAIVYTLWLKPSTPQNIVIGGAAGAMPPVLGWAAMRGDVGVEAVILWLIILLWTPPHFWALALYRINDYRRSGLPMLPITHGSLHTRSAMLAYSAALFVATLLPLAVGMSGAVYAVFAVPLGAVFIWRVWQLRRCYSDALARSIFRYSIVFLGTLFAALLVDRAVRGW